MTNVNWSQCPLKSNDGLTPHYVFMWSKHENILISCFCQLFGKTYIASILSPEDWGQYAPAIKLASSCSSARRYCTVGQRRRLSSLLQHLTVSTHSGRVPCRGTEYNPAHEENQGNVNIMQVPHFTFLTVYKIMSLPLPLPFHVYLNTDSYR
jgi:hypothetical protein